MEKVEALAQGLSDLLERFSKEMRAITEEVMGTGRHRSLDELRQRIRTVQEEVYREALQTYGDLLGATVDAERELVARITRLRELKERAGVLKEVIATMVKAGNGK